METKEIEAKVIRKASKRGAEQWGDHWQYGILVYHQNKEQWKNLQANTQKAVENLANTLEIDKTYKFELSDEKTITGYKPTIIETETTIDTAPQTQTQIRREACLNSAIEYHKLTPNIAPTKQVILETAQEFEKWVIRND